MYSTQYHVPPPPPPPPHYHQPPHHNYQCVRVLQRMGMLVGAYGHVGGGFVSTLELVLAPDTPVPSWLGGGYSRIAVELIPQGQMTVW